MPLHTSGSLAQMVVKANRSPVNSERLQELMKDEFTRKVNKERNLDGEAESWSQQISITTPATHVLLPASTPWTPGRGRTRGQGSRLHFLFLISGDGHPASAWILPAVGTHQHTVGQFPPARSWFPGIGLALFFSRTSPPAPLKPFPPLSPQWSLGSGVDHTNLFCTPSLFLSVTVHMKLEHTEYYLRKTIHCHRSKAIQILLLWVLLENNKVVLWHKIFEE